MMTRTVLQLMVGAMLVQGMGCDKEELRNPAETAENSGSTVGGEAGSTAGTEDRDSTGATVEAGSIGATAGSGQDDHACHELSVDACSRNEATCVVIRGSRYDTKQQCSHPAEGVGCREKSKCGDGAITHAEDPEGQRWWFPSDCVPRGWSVLDPEEEVLPSAFDWPACE